MAYIPVHSTSTGKLLFKFDPTRMLVEIKERIEVLDGRGRKQQRGATTIVDLALYASKDDSK